MTPKQILLSALKSGSINPASPATGHVGWLCNNNSDWMGIFSHPDTFSYSKGLSVITMAGLTVEQAEVINDLSLFGKDFEWDPETADIEKGTYYILEYLKPLK